MFVSLLWQSKLIIVDLYHLWFITGVKSHGLRWDLHEFTCAPTKHLHGRFFNFRLPKWWEMMRTVRTATSKRCVSRNNPKLISESFMAQTWGWLNSLHNNSFRYVLLELPYDVFIFHTDLKKKQLNRILAPILGSPARRHRCLLLRTPAESKGWREWENSMGIWYTVFGYRRSTHIMLWRWWWHQSCKQVTTSSLPFSCAWHHWFQ